MAVLLRLFADSANSKQAENLTNAVSNVLSAFVPIPTMPAQRYWKIPEYFEFCFALSPDTRLTFDQILSYADDWLLSGDDNNSSAVWLRSTNSQFLLSEIAWAELILSS